MTVFLKYLNLIKQKPSILLRGIKYLFLARVLNKRVLRGVELAITYQCFGKCEKCSCFVLKEDNRKEMSKEQILNIADQIVKLGAILINITGGDPLLRNDVLDILFELRKKPVIVSLSTNGLLLTDSLLIKLKNAGLNVIQISLNSPDEKEHDKEIGINGSYKKVIASISKASQLDIEVLINFVVTKEMLYSDKIGKMVDIARRYNSYLSLIFPAQIGGWQKKEVNLNIKDYELVKKWLKLKFVTADTETCYYKGFCPAGIDKAYISPYGDFYPCPFIQKKYGNVLESNFVSLWNNMDLIKHKGCRDIVKC